MYNYLSRRIHAIRTGQTGIAMITVIMGVLAITMLAIMIQQLATNQLTQSSNQAREDTVLTGTEAMLERFATKQSIDPLYYQKWVDEAEAPRKCTDTGSAQFGAIANPGDVWFGDCGTWDYEATTTFYEHPLLDGDPANTADNIGVLIHVTPPDGAVPLKVEVVGRQNERINPRVVESEIQPESISEFAWMVEGQLRFGSGAVTYGKVYTGDDVGGRPGWTAHANVYAEGRIGIGSTYPPPIWKTGAQGWDSTGSHNTGGQRVTDIYPDSIDFDKFWDDLDLIQNAACTAGICLDPAVDARIPSGVDAYLLETVNTAGISKIKVSYATATPFDSCSSSAETRWKVASSSASWTYLDTYDIPKNGALWGNEHIVIGRNSGSPFHLGGALTVYAGTSSARRNVIMSSDITYVNGMSGTDVLGLVASDEVILNPRAAGNDGLHQFYAATLSQNGQVNVPCGGYVPGGTTLTNYGSNATLGTGNMSCCYSPRNYNFDLRLTQLRPPLFPLLSDKWTYTNWKESPIPDWARP
jgi:uncharacterized membrane protein